MDYKKLSEWIRKAGGIQYVGVGGVEGDWRVLEKIINVDPAGVIFYKRTVEELKIFNGSFIYSKYSSEPYCRKYAKSEMRSLLTFNVNKVLMPPEYSKVLFEFLIYNCSLKNSIVIRNSIIENKLKLNA